MAALAELALAEGLDILGWRQVPVNDSMIGAMAKSCMPDFWQLFITDNSSAGIELDRAVTVFAKSRSTISMSIFLHYQVELCCTREC